MDRSILLLVLRVILIVSMVTFMIMFVSLDKTDCEKCRFEIDNVPLDVHEFMDLFYEGCITPYRSLLQHQESYDLEGLEVVE